MISGEGGVLAGCVLAMDRAASILGLLESGDVVRHVLSGLLMRS